MADQIKAKRAVSVVTLNDYDPATDFKLGATPGSFRILVKNVGGASIKYKALGYAYPGGSLPLTVQSEATLTAGSQAEILVLAQNAVPFADVIVSIKNAAYSVASTVTLEAASVGSKLRVA